MSVGKTHGDGVSASSGNKKMQSEFDRESEDSANKLSLEISKNKGFIIIKAAGNNNDGQTVKGTRSIDAKWDMIDRDKYPEAYERVVVAGSWQCRQELKWF